jgi:PAB1-binding protein PBP1
LDKNSAEYRAKEREAARLAEEIEKSTAGNVHMAEERGQELADDQMDEEDRYGAVIRQSQRPSVNIPRSLAKQLENIKTEGSPELKSSSADEPEVKKGRTFAEMAAARNSAAKPAVSQPKPAAPQESKASKPTDTSKSKMKFNPNAMEFKFSPAAVEFSPNVMSPDVAQITEELKSVSILKSSTKNVSFSCLLQLELFQKTFARRVIQNS